MDETIEKIETISVRIPFHIWAPAPMSQGLPRTHIEGLYIRVTTASGLVGWGESFGTAKPMVVAAFDHWIRRLAVGQKATDLDLVTRIERTALSLGRMGPFMAALSGLDIALWDIRGKIESAPVCALLGGAKRQRVECYASLMQYYGEEEHLARNVERALRQGYRWIKIHERTAEAVAIARRAAGPEIPLMVDTNCAWTIEQAEAAVRSMKPMNPYWIEEPIFPPEDYESIARLRARTQVPLGMGENATSRFDFTTMVNCGAADFVQPSIVKMGGISAMISVANQVEALGAICVPNAFYIGPGYLAALHCMAVKEKPAPLERMFAQLEFTPFGQTVNIVDGNLIVPDRPGLGADPEEELLERYKV